MRYLPRYLQFTIGLLLLASAVARPAAADVPLDFTLFPTLVNVQQGDMFTIDAILSNPIINSGSYDVASLFLTSPGLVLGSDLVDDPTNFFLNFAPTYAPGDTTSGALEDFQVSNTAPVGFYTVGIEVRDPGGSALAQSSFNVNVTPGASGTPEFGSATSLGGFLTAVGGVLWLRQRKGKVIASDA